MQVACVCAAVAALSFSGAAAQSFALSGEGAPLGGPFGDPRGALPAALELDSFLEADEGEMAQLNAPLTNEEDWEEDTQQTFLEPHPSLNYRPEDQLQQQQQQQQQQQRQHQQEEGSLLRRRRDLAAGALQPDIDGYFFPSSQQQQQLQQHQQGEQQDLSHSSPPAASALQLHDTKAMLSGIGSALLGSAAGTLLGGARQTLQGPFALNTPQTNLTANLGSPAAATATPAAVAATPAAAAAAPAAAPAAAAMPMAPLPFGSNAASATSADASHHVTGVVIGVIVGLLVLCLVGGCVWKLTKKKRRR